MSDLNRTIVVMLLCAGVMLIVLPLCMDESESERWAGASPIERLPIVIFAGIVGVAAGVIRWMCRMDSFNCAMIMMLLCAGMIVFAIIDLTYTTVHDSPITRLGAEVQTTDEYTDMFNDSFTGRVVRGTSFFERAVTVRSPEGVERRIVIKWLEAVKDG